MRVKMLLRALGAGAVLLAIGASSALATNKTFTFSGTSNLACSDFACSDFVVTIKHPVAITGGNWTEVDGSITSSHKKVKAGGPEDCEYPDLGTVSVTFNNPGVNPPDAADLANVTVISTASKIVGGVLVNCRQEKVVAINGAQAAAVTVNFDVKDIVQTPGASPVGLGIVASLMAILGGVLVLRRRRFTQNLA